MLDVDQQRRELSATPGVATDRKRAERVAVVAHAPRDEASLAAARPSRRNAGAQASARLRSPPIRRRRDRRARCPRARRAISVVGEFLGDRRREETRMRIRQRVNLRVHRGEHVGMPMAEARHRGAARGVEIALSTCVGDPATVTGHRDRVLTAQLAMKNSRLGVHGPMIGVTPAADLLLLVQRVWRRVDGRATARDRVADKPRAAGGKCPPQCAVAGVQHQVRKRRTSDRSVAPSASRAAVRSTAAGRRRQCCSQVPRAPRRAGQRRGSAGSSPDRRQFRRSPRRARDRRAGQRRAGGVCR